jgi:hypothetical protein
MSENRDTIQDESPSIPAASDDQLFDDEVWKDIDFTEGLYEVSNYGRVRSTSYLIEVNGGSYWHKGKVLKQHLANCREMMVGISCAQLGLKRKPYLVNRLVAKAFIPNPNDLPEAIHINGNNLDNRVENLQWATRTECVRKDIAQQRRSESLKVVKYGSMPSDEFMNRQHIGRSRSQEKRRRGVDVFDENNNLIHNFNTVKEAEISLKMCNGHIHTCIKRGGGIGRAKGYVFKFSN